MKLAIDIGLLVIGSILIGIDIGSNAGIGMALLALYIKTGD